MGSPLYEALPQYGKPWYKVPHLLKLNLLLLIPLMSSSVTGYDSSLMNGLQALPAWQDAFGNPVGYNLGLVNAALAFGGLVALPFCSTMSDGIGRKWTLFIGGLAIIIGSVIQAVSVNLGMFVFSRVFVGVGSMLVVQPSPMLISEICYPPHRGIYTALYWTNYYLGAIIAAWSTYGLQKSMPTSDWAWRGPSILQGGLPLLQLLLWYKLPESPRWLVAKGKIAEARATLAKYHTGGDESHELISLEMEEIMTAITLEQEAEDTKWSALISTPANRRRLLITCLIGFFSQWVGNGVVSYYLTLVLDTVGITDPDTQTLINGLLQVFNFIVAIGAALLVDKLGRRTLWNWSGIGMLISFIIWTACSARFADTPTNSLGYTVIAFIFIFFFHYDIAYTPMLMAYPTEILQYSIRSKGLAVELGIVYASLIALAFINPIALAAIGWRYYIVFCCIIAASVVANWILLPETKNLSLEETSDLFTGESKHIRTGNDKSAKISEVQQVDKV